jgi:hypothetical protein
MVNRAGRSKLGCLVLLLLFASAVYFGVNIGNHFWKDYQLRDTMRQEARFAARRDDVAIARHIAAKADSLGLPPEAGNVQVRRSGGVIYIFTEYRVRVEFPFFVRDFSFAPSAQAPF